MVSKLMDNAYLDGYGSCQHNQIGSPRFIVAFCDASNEEWGLLLYAVEEEYDPSSDVFPPKEKLIEAHAGEWDDKKVNYHVNRKEAITLHRTMKAITEWLPRFMLDVRQRLQVSIYCDNSSAVAWANKGSVSMRSYDKVALQRLSESMSDMRRDCQLQFSVTLNVKYIQGLKNKIADRLSRSDIRSHMLPPLKSNTHKTPTPKEPDETVVMIATPSGELGLVDTVGLPHRGVWSSHMMDPMYVPMRTDNDLDEPLDVLVASPLKGAAATSDYESLVGLGNWQLPDILDHLRQAFKDKAFLEKEEVTQGVTYLDLISSLQPDMYPDCRPSTRAQNLAEGSSKGPLYRWNKEQKILQAIDPREDKPLWCYVLITHRAQMWAIYKVHDHPLAGHKGLPRAVFSMRKLQLWWPTQVSDTNRFIRSCKICQLAKLHDVPSTQPLAYRRWQKRFETIQIDWMGPFAPTTQNGPCPLLSPDSPVYYCIMICEATKVMMAIPSRSNDTRCLISCLMQWIAAYGPPCTLQMDNAGAHHNASELYPFLQYWDIHPRYGLSRRPESQGLVERAIRDLKDGIRMANIHTAASTLPWWAAVQIATVVHNNSMKSGIVPCSPNELALGDENSLIRNLGRGGGETPESIWGTVNSVVKDLFEANQVAVAERALAAETQELAKSQPKARFVPEQEVKMSRIVNGKRELSGPYKILSVSNDNPMVFQLEGHKFPVPISHLLPFNMSVERDRYDHAAKPGIDRLSVSLKDKAPWGIPLDEATKRHWVVYRVLDETDESPEPITTIYIAQVIAHKADQKLLVQGLDSTNRGSWKLPPKGHRSDAQHLILYDDVVGRKAFLPTAKDRLPKIVQEWLNSVGVSC